MVQLSEFLERRETCFMERAGPRPAAGDEGARSLHGALNRYLENRFPHLGSSCVRSLRILPGGYSKETALLQLAPNREFPDCLVIRRDRAHGGSTGTSVANEFPLLQQMHAASLPVPRPWWCEPDPGSLGGAFILVEEIAGAARAGELFPELNTNTYYHPQFAHELACALATLHRMTSLPEAFGTSGFAAYDVDPTVNVRSFQRLWRELPNHPPHTAAVETGYAWLLAHPLPSGRPRRVVHSDVGAHNIMLRDGHLAALLDWELTHIGDPAEDLAYVRTLLVEPLLPWSEFVSAYAQAGGPADACDTPAINWFAVWNHVRNSTYTAMLYARAERGELRDINSVAAAWDYTWRLQRYLARDLARAVHLS
jgi:aminoglycoside phosphotransferase (APT) family kinase protein